MHELAKDEDDEQDNEDEHGPMQGVVSGDGLYWVGGDIGSRSERARAQGQEQGRGAARLRGADDGKQKQRLNGPPPLYIAKSCYSFQAVEQVKVVFEPRSVTSTPELSQGWLTCAGKYQIHCMGQDGAHMQIGSNGNGHIEFSSMSTHCLQSRKHSFEYVNFKLTAAQFSVVVVWLPLKAVSESDQLEPKTPSCAEILTPLLVHL
ncbi:hypothetical protein C8R45DRAFT_933178 [Mycena sanguinolenta]|nr:hypothetical protein C8R45DRAFT_933178 [Mycena sanguinolenta]